MTVTETGKDTVTEKVNSDSNIDRDSDRDSDRDTFCFTAVIKYNAAYTKEYSIITQSSLFHGNK